MSVINYIDSLIQGEQRIIAEPSNTAYPTSITKSNNSNGTCDIILTWSYTQGANKADTLGIFWETGTTLATTATPTLTSKYIQLTIDTPAHIFQGIDPTKAYKASIAVGFTSEKGIIIGTLVHTGAVTWEVEAGTSNNTNNIGGVNANSIVDSLLSITDDGIIDVNEKTGIRSEWTNISSEKAGIDAQATALGITTEKTTYDTTFQILANFLNNGTTWTTGWPYFINDTQKDINTDITPSGRNTFISITRDFYVAKEMLNNKMHEIASQTALWSKTTNKPNAILYSTNPATSLGLNPTFSEWPGAYPTGWGPWYNDTITKETTIVRYLNAVKLTGVSGQHSGIYITSVWSGTGKFPSNSIVTMAVDVYIKTCVSGSPTIYLADGVTWAAALVPTSTIGAWQTVNLTFRTGSAPTSATVLLTANWIGMGDFVGQVIYGGFSFTVQKAVDIDNKQQAASDIQGQLNGATQLLDASLTAVKTNIAAINSSSGNLAAAQASVIQGFFGTLSALNANLGTVTAGTVDTTGYVRARGAVSAAGYNCAVVANDSNTQQVGLLGYGTYAGSILTGGSYGLIATGTTGFGIVGQVTTGSGVKGYGPTGVYGLSSSGGYAVHADGILYCTSLQTGSTGQVGNLNATYLQGYTPGSFALSGHTHSYVGSVYCTYNGYSAIPYSNQIQMHSAIGGYGFNGRSTNVIELLSFSDERLKNSIADETLGLEFIRQVKYKTYKLNSDSTYKWHGVIAQDIKEIAPEGVDSLFQIHDDGMYGVDYNSLHSVAGKALQELDALVLAQQELINNLLTRIEALENK